MVDADSDDPRIGQTVLHVQNMSLNSLNDAAHVLF